MSPGFASQVQQQRGRGQSLDRLTRSAMQGILAADTDLELIRVHRGAAAKRLASAVDSQAFSVGSDIFLRSEETPELLSHELTHVARGSPKQAEGRMHIVRQPASASAERPSIDRAGLIARWDNLKSRWDFLGDKLQDAFNKLSTQETHWDELVFRAGGAFDEAYAHYEESLKADAEMKKLVADVVLGVAFAGIGAAGTRAVMTLSALQGLSEPGEEVAKAAVGAAVSESLKAGRTLAPREQDGGGQGIKSPLAYFTEHGERLKSVIGGIKGFLSSTRRDITGIRQLCFSNAASLRDGTIPDDSLTAHAQIIGSHEDIFRRLETRYLTAIDRLTGTTIFAAGPLRAKLDKSYMAEDLERRMWAHWLTGIKRWEVIDVGSASQIEYRMESPELQGRELKTEPAETLLGEREALLLAFYEAVAPAKTRLTVLGVEEADVGWFATQEERRILYEWAVDFSPPPLIPEL